MTISPEQLSAQLERGLLPCYLISGDEPLLVDETLDSIRAACRANGVTDRTRHVAERGFDWQAVQAAAGNLSLFGDRQLIEVRLPTGKPGDAGSRVLTALAEAASVDTVLVVVTPALDKRSMGSRWATALARAGTHVNIRKVEVAALPAWIRRRLGRAGLTVDPDALELLVDRVEGNLLAAQQEIDKLELLGTEGNLGIEDIRQSVANGSRFDVFRLADAAVGQRPDRVVRMLTGLRREGIAVQLVAWALTREIIGLAELRSMIDAGMRPSEAMAKLRVWRSRLSIVERGIRAHDARSMSDLVARSARCDLVAKGARRGDPWAESTALALALAGERVDEIGRRELMAVRAA